jgi:hypothetical protein
MCVRLGVVMLLCCGHLLPTAVYLPMYGAPTYECMYRVSTHVWMYRCTCLLHALAGKLKTQQLQLADSGLSATYENYIWPRLFRRSRGEAGTGTGLAMVFATTRVVTRWTLGLFRDEIAGRRARRGLFP